MTACAHLERLLPLNTAAECDGMLALLLKVLDNIVAHPEEAKFHQLKLSNGAVKRKIADVKGGLELLRHMGFVRTVDPMGGAFLVIEQLATPEQAVARAARDASFADLRAWLVAQQGAIAKMARDRAAARASSSDGVGAGGPLAECTLAIKMASGTTVTGAFRPSETLRDVQRFVAGFRAPDAPSPVICANCPHREFGDVQDGGSAALDTTLTEAALTPRAALFVKRESKVVVAKVMENLQEQRAAQRSREVAARAVRSAAKKATADARQQSIESFRADREDDAQRAAWRKAANVRAAENAAAEAAAAARAEAALIAGSGGQAAEGEATIFGSVAAANHRKEESSVIDPA